MGASAMRPIIDSRALAIFARLAVGGVFVGMSLSKLANPPDFVQVLCAYKMLPTDPVFVTPFLALWMLWLELLMGLCLLSGTFARGAACVACVMLVVFTVAVSLRGMAFLQAGTPFFDIEFDCGCGAGVIHLWKKLLENTGLILGSLLLWVTRAPLWTLLSFERRPAAA